MDIKTATGSKAVRRMFDSLFAETLPDIHNVYGVTDIDRLKADFPEFEYSTSNAARIKAGLKGHLIYTSSEGPIYQSSDELNNRASRFFAPGELPYPSDFTILGDWVIFITSRNKTPWATALKNTQLSEAFTELFNFLWKVVPSYD